MSAKEQAAAMRRTTREAIVQALREGRRQRAVRFVDRKKENDKRACRVRVQKEETHE